MLGAEGEWVLVSALQFGWMMEVLARACKLQTS